MNGKNILQARNLQMLVNFSKFPLKKTFFIILPCQGNLFFLWGKLVSCIYHRVDSFWRTDSSKYKKPKLLIQYEKVFRSNIQAVMSSWDIHRLPLRLHEFQYMDATQGKGGVKRLAPKPTWCLHEPTGIRTFTCSARE